MTLSFVKGEPTLSNQKVKELLKTSNFGVISKELRNQIEEAPTLQTQGNLSIHKNNHTQTEMYQLR